MDKINEFLTNNYQGHELPGLGELSEVTKRIECKDGFSISV